MIMPRTLAIFIIAAVLAACDHTPPLPPELPKAEPDLMQPSAALPDLPEHKPAGISELYANNVNVRSVCVVDRRRLADLQKYVRGLTK